ncbi:NlpC/P60 family protein [Fictibacillus gelatini]|uniref:C40 family peptidase n=1 Tax=Fictibacillus gelatini TaxID=225985 RepID=UPI00047D35EF|nr:NlpC/P60 family protein [Fictibacillus gelatini]
MENEWIVNVSVATLWTSPESPREKDQLLLSNPAQIKKWISSNSYDDKLELHAKNMIQSQLLYGQKVIVTEENGEWLSVLVPDQPSGKNESGYPGWIPKQQLTPASSFEGGSYDSFAVISSPTAFLYRLEEKKEIEISFNTRLAIQQIGEEWVEVRTVDGTKKVRRNDVEIFSVYDGIPKGTGQDIVRAAEKFLNLEYLWGGMSGFGYDCSGFAYTMHHFNGITIPRDASDQHKRGKKVTRDELEPGDLVFFAYDEGKGFVHHVGIYYGNDQMIHSPKTGKTVEIITLTNSPYEIEFCGGRRFGKE